MVIALLRRTGFFPAIWQEVIDLKSASGSPEVVQIDQSALILPLPWKSIFAAYAVKLTGGALVGVNIPSHCLHGRDTNLENRQTQAGIKCQKRSILKPLFPQVNACVAPLCRASALRGPG
ncbi:MAG: hypothetical protein ACTSY1_04525, partial [Alphaproteobacteria bacterium]